MQDLQSFLLLHIYIPTLPLHSPMVERSVRNVFMYFLKNLSRYNIAVSDTVGRIVWQELHPESLA